MELVESSAILGSAYALPPHDRQPAARETRRRREAWVTHSLARSLRYTHTQSTVVFLAELLMGDGEGWEPLATGALSLKLGFLAVGSMLVVVARISATPTRQSRTSECSGKHASRNAFSEQMATSGPPFERQNT